MVDQSTNRGAPARLGVVRCEQRSNSQDARDPATRLVGRPAREGEQQNPSGIGAARNQVRHAVRKRVRLARPRTRDHQQRRIKRSAILAGAIQHRLLPRLVQRLQLGRKLGAPSLAGRVRHGASGALPGKLPAIEVPLRVG